MLIPTCIWFSCCSMAATRASIGTLKDQCTGCLGLLQFGSIRGAVKQPLRYQACFNTSWRSWTLPKTVKTCSLSHKGNKVSSCLLGRSWLNSETQRDPPEHAPTHTPDRPAPKRRRKRKGGEQEEADPGAPKGRLGKGRKVRIPNILWWVICSAKTKPIPARPLGR